MNRQLANSIVQCLRLDADVEPAARRLARFTDREWRRLYYWLDWSGLALYLLAALERRGLSHCLPPPVRARLQQNFRDNRERNRGMLDETARIAARFETVGVRFAIMKGFTLVPVACADAALRHQSDLDFLVDPATLHRADAALRGLGYRFAKTSAETYTYARQLGFVPRHEDMYRPGTHHAVEIHSVLWEFLVDIGAAPPADAILRAERRLDSALPFPALNSVDQLLHQAVHVVVHLLLYWVRIGWLYELARAVEHHRADALFWSQLRDRCRQQPNYAPVVATGIRLAQQIFGVTAGPEAELWLQQSVSPGIAYWLEHYGAECVLTQYPGTKLTMLLHRELMSPAAWAAYEWEKLLPLHAPPSATLVDEAEAHRSFSARVRQWRYGARRGAFHVVEGARYLYARWKWDRTLNSGGNGTQPPVDGAPAKEVTNLLQTANTPATRAD